MQNPVIAGSETAAEEERWKKDMPKLADIAKKGIDENKRVAEQIRDAQKQK